MTASCRASRSDPMNASVPLIDTAHSLGATATTRISVGDGAGDDHGEARGRAADLEWGATEGARDEAADDRGYQPGQQWGTGGGRDPE